MLGVEGKTIRVALNSQQILLIFKIPGSWRRNSFANQRAVGHAAVSFKERRMPADPAIHFERSLFASIAPARYSFVGTVVTFPSS